MAAVSKEQKSTGPGRKELSNDIPMTRRPSLKKSLVVMVSNQIDQKMLCPSLPNVELIWLIRNKTKLKDPKHATNWFQHKFFFLNKLLPQSLCSHGCRTKVCAMARSITALQKCSKRSRERQLNQCWCLRLHHEGFSKGGSMAVVYWDLGRCETKKAGPKDGIRFGHGKGCRACSNVVTYCNGSKYVTARSQNHAIHILGTLTFEQWINIVFVGLMSEMKS